MAATLVALLMPGMWACSGEGRDGAGDSVGAANPGDGVDAFTTEALAWQAEREEGLLADDSWLTVAGLYWLREGSNTVGADGSNDFVLPEGSAPAEVGVFEFADRVTTFHASPGVEILQSGEPVTSVVLEMGEKHALEIGRLRLWLHYSGERLAIRLRDLDAPLRKEFTGLNWFPPDERFRVTARFTPYDEPKKIEMLNILGDIEPFESPGTVEFELLGETIRMEPLSVRDGALWLVFRDGTSGKEVYPAARFLRAEAPVDGEVVLDFNRAYNPPCAYNPFTTCPIPTKQNRLAVRIEAGEKLYQNHL